MRIYRLFLLYLSVSFAHDSAGQTVDTKMHCKIIRAGSYLFIIDRGMDLVKMDTITVLDVGDVNNCISGIDSDFNLKEYNVYKKKWSSKEAYFDKARQDTVVAWLPLYLFVFDGIVKYNNLRSSPSHSYHTYEYNGKRHVFKSLTYIDVKEIWFKKTQKKLVKFKYCYHPVHSLLE
jgi:hypothetical protein